MSTFIALLRGINLVGKNTLPMKELAGLLEELGAAAVRTYIQSGNAVFEYPAKGSPLLAGKLAAAIRQARGFEPWILILPLADLERALADNPFPEAEATPSTLHLGFLASIPKAPDDNKLNRLKRPSERYHLGGRVFYLHAPDGFARSKLAAGAEKAIGAPMTVRNWRTVNEIRRLACR